MGLSVISRHFPTTNALKEHANTRLSRALKHFDNGDVSITMEKSAPNLFMARASSKIGGRPIFAQASASDMYVAVARAALRLQKQMDRTKGKERPTTGARLPLVDEALDEALDDDLDD